MFIARLFRRSAAIQTNFRTTDESIQELAKVRRSLKRRERRIAFLRKRIRDERRAHAAELSARDDAVRVQQQQLIENSKIASTDNHDVSRLRHDLETAIAMLDEFEAEARQNRDANTRKSELEAENATQRQVIAGLERELQVWHGTQAVAA